MLNGLKNDENTKILILDFAQLLIFIIMEQTKSFKSFFFIVIRNNYEEKQIEIVFGIAQLCFLVEKMFI